MLISATVRPKPSYYLGVAMQDNLSSCTIFCPGLTQSMLFQQRGALCHIWFYASSVVCGVLCGSLQEHDGAISTVSEASLREHGGSILTTP